MLQDNLILSTESILFVARVLAFRRSELCTCQGKLARVNAAKDR